MKFIGYAAVFLPLVGAFQPIPNRSRGAANDGIFLFQPDLNWDASKADNAEPLSNILPDCTKPEFVSTLNKGTYEALNGHQTYQAVNGPQFTPSSVPVPAKMPPTPPPTPPSSSNGSLLNGADLFLPDPANNPIN